MFHWKKAREWEFNNKWHWHSPEPETGNDGLCVLYMASLERDTPLYLSIIAAASVEVKQCCQIVRFFQEMPEYELYAISRILNAGS